MILDAKGHETNGNGASLTERQRAKMMAQNCTVGEANHIATEHARGAMQLLGNQIPDYVRTVVEAAIRGYHESLVERGIIPAAVPVTFVAPENAEKDGVIPTAVDGSPVTPTDSEGDE